MTKDERDELEKPHKGDWKTLIKIYQSDGKFYSTWFFLVPLILSTLFVAIGLFNKMDFYTAMTGSFFNIITTIIPCLLGFNLGAFILVVGFGGVEILKNITISLPEQLGFSFYQKMISVLAFSVLIEIITLSSNFIFQISTLWNFTSSSSVICLIINSIATWILTFFTFYSLSQLFVVVRHVFLFGQTIQMNIKVGEYLDKNKVAGKKNEDAED